MIAITIRCCNVCSNLERCSILYSMHIMIVHNIT